MVPQECGHIVINFGIMSSFCEFDHILRKGSSVVLKALCNGL